jgi:ketosteroid isomerase-like protein
VKGTGRVLLLVVAAVAGAGGRDQKDGAAQSSDAETRALIAVENRWVEALVKSDLATLDAIVADSYVDTDEHSHRGNKDDVISFLKSGDIKFESIKLSDMNAHVYGDAAVVFGTAVQAGSFLGGPLATKVIFTDTFVKKNGKWKAVASHRSVAS